MNENDRWNNDQYSTGSGGPVPSDHLAANVLTEDSARKKRYPSNTGSSPSMPSSSGSPMIWEDEGEDQATNICRRPRQNSWQTVAQTPESPSQRPPVSAPSSIPAPNTASSLNEYGSGYAYGSESAYPRTQTFYASNEKYEVPYSNFGYDAGQEMDYHTMPVSVSPTPYSMAKNETQKSDSKKNGFSQSCLFRISSGLCNLSGRS